MFKNLVGNVLYYVKNINKPNAYQSIKKISKKNIKHLAAKEKVGKVLIAPYRMSKGSNLFEGNLSLALEDAGYSVDLFLCGGANNYCEQVDMFKKHWPRCQVCMYEQDKFSESYGLKSYSVRGLIDPEDIISIRSFIGGLDFNTLPEIDYKGVSIYKPLLSAIQLYKKSVTLDTVKDLKIIEGYLETICKTIDALEKYFKRNDVDFVVVSHGVYSTWGTIQAYCLAHNIHFVTWGREYHGAGIIAAHNDSYLNQPMYEKNDIWSKDLTIDQIEKAERYLKQKVGIIENTSDYLNYHKSTKRVMDAKQVYSKLGILETSKVIGLFPNIPWDGQAFRPAKIFDDIDAWIIETIKFFQAKENTYLVIRSHPAELHADGGDGITIKELIQNYFGEDLPDNIIILPPDSEVSSLSVASISKACLLYGSTIGYETMYLRVPTILASDFYYSNKGISFDPGDKDEYYSLIQKGLDGQLIYDQERYDKLIKYTYHYQFRRIMPETVMSLNGLDFKSFNYSDRAGVSRDKSLLKFIQCCESGDDFYFDELYS